MQRLWITMGQEGEKEDHQPSPDSGSIGCLDSKIMNVLKQSRATRRTIERNETARETSVWRDTTGID